MIEFRMPSLGSDMDEGTLLEWRIAPGDPVRRGDIVAVVDTDKAEIEVESWDEGIVEQILIPAGRTVPVGTPLATFRGAEEAAGPAPGAVAAAPAPIPQDANPPAGRVHATPLARRTAAERGLDLTRLAGSGPEGAITRKDVEAAAPEPRPVPTSTTAEPSVAVSPGAEPPTRAAGMRRAIAAAMQRSKREIPHYYLETAIDFGAARAWLEAENRERPIDERLLPPALLLRATALALRAVPELNGYWVDDRLEVAEAVHLGFAVSLRGGGGLLAPVVRDAHRKKPGEIMGVLRDLVARARSGRLRSSEVTGATCTITSLGDAGVDKVFGIIVPPQVAVVGFGAVAERPWVRDGWIAARPVLSATLSADHRATDGQRGARFLARLAWLLERPEEL